MDRLPESELFVQSTEKQDRSLTWLVGILAGFIITAVSFLFLGNGMSVRFTPAQMIALVEIDGVNYGSFRIPGDIRDLTVPKAPGSDSFIKIRLKRDFVTDPSLALWARETKQSSASRAQLPDIRLTMSTASGREISHYTLKYCMPLSWSIGSSGVSTGGFNEQVDIAAQDIMVD